MWARGDLGLVFVGGGKKVKGTGNLGGGKCARGNESRVLSDATEGEAGPISSCGKMRKVSFDAARRQQTQQTQQTPQTPRTPQLGTMIGLCSLAGALFGGAGEPGGPGPNARIAPVL